MFDPDINGQRIAGNGTSGFLEGYLKPPLRTLPVNADTCNDKSKYRFSVLNRKTGNRVESRYVDSVTHRPVAAKNQVKGFPVWRGRLCVARG